MPSERALLIKQRQQEAIKRQKQEIAERDDIRKQRELGITPSQSAQPVEAPQTLHDLFNSRYEPKSHQAQNAHSNPETARLRAYEQKRARFMARKRAEMQQSIQHTQHQTPDIQQSTHTLQQTSPQRTQHQTYNIPPEPVLNFTSNPPIQHTHQLPQAHNIQNISKQPSPTYILPEKYKSEIDPQPNYDDKYNQVELIKQKKAKQEKYREELLQQMREQEIQNILGNNKTNINNDNHNGYFGTSENDKAQKRAKQEKYRQELLKQMREQQMNNGKSMNKYNKNNKLFGNEDEMKQMENTNEDRKYYYAKQLEEQMKLKKLTKMAEKEKQLLEDRKLLMGGGFLDGFGNNKIPQIQISYSPQISSMPSNNEYTTLEQGHNDFEYMRYNDTKKEQPILDKKALYKMELDKQCKELQEKKMREKLLNEKEELRLNEKIKKDRQQLINEKYREDLDQQMKELQERRKRQKINDDRQDMKLEMKIKRERQLIENENTNSKNMGIFGKNLEREKLEKARKREQYQEELKQQALEIKRKKREKELEEKEKERKLELKIQKELQELEKKYQQEKEFEAMNMSNLSIANGVNIAKRPNVNKSNINLQNMSNLSIANGENIAKLSNTSTKRMRPNIQNVENTTDITSSISRSPIIDHGQHDEIKKKRPSTSRQMFQEILSLKQDLLENQKLMRKELQMHKQQINQQIANANQTENDKLEMNKYHDKISNEIESLKNVILKQQLDTKKTQKIAIKENNKKISDFEQDDEISLKNIIDKSSQFIPCTVPETPITIRPDTTLTSFTTTSICNSDNDNDNNNNNVLRINTGFTEFGVDEYLLNECKNNNEFLLTNNKNNNTGLHTPNIFRVDSIERDLNFNQTFDDINGKNICEKSIKSKSDFLYSKNEDVFSERQHVDDKTSIDDEDKNQTQTKCADNIVNKLLLKNKNRLNYFRSTTPLDSTRSMKIGLQKIQDLLRETEKLNTTNTNNNNNKNINQHDRSYDSSLYELI